MDIYIIHSSKSQHADGTPLDWLYESQAEGKRMSVPADGDT